jgi:hypothetical protein
MMEYMEVLKMKLETTMMMGITLFLCMANLMNRGLRIIWKVMMRVANKGSDSN